MNSVPKKNVDYGAHLYSEWYDKIAEDGMFQDKDCASHWFISETNAEEFLEAIEVRDHMTSDELVGLIRSKNSSELNYDQLVPHLSEFLLHEKKIPLTDLFEFEDTFMPIDRIKKFLKMFKMDLQHQSNCDQGEGLSEIQKIYLKEIKFAENNLNAKSLFKSNVGKLRRQSSRRDSMRDQWIQKYSDVGSVLSDANTLSLSKKESSHLDYDILSPDFLPVEKPRGRLRRISTIGHLETLLSHHQDKLEHIGEVKFDIFKFNEEVGRKHTLPVLMLTTMYNTGLKPLINQQKVAVFLDRVITTYKQEVGYHNDLHGADVLQMAYYMLSTCGLQTKLQLNKLDTLSVLMAAVCHDLGHDGFTNNYHVNDITRRAIDSNDVSVQESFHASEFFRILDNDDLNFMEGLTRAQFKVFRKRVLGLILATDMAKHMSDLASFKALLTEYDIKDGNLEALVQTENEAVRSNNQQIVLETCMHACDVSQQGRSFKVVKEWTYLLFEEFFYQGDMEYEKGLPISMLCDRKTTNVAASQAGFIGFIPLPIYTALTNVIPKLEQCVIQMKANSATWKEYQENDEDKKVYEIRGLNWEPKVKNIIKGNSQHEEEKE